MGKLTEVHQKYIAEVTARYQPAGVTHVTAMSVNDEHVCDICHNAHLTVIPLDDMIKHYEACDSPDGCRCYFRPVMPE